MGQEQKDARCAADTRKAQRAIDNVMRADYSIDTALTEVYHLGWLNGYSASEEHHNGHYGVTDDSAVHVPHVHLMKGIESSVRTSCSDVSCHALDGRPCTYCGGQPCRVVLP